jgi:hypothetical protein
VVTGPASGCLRAGAGRVVQRPDRVGQVFPGHCGGCSRWCQRSNADGLEAWNEALARINLVTADEIVEAAHAIDDEIWPNHQQIKRGWIPEGGWPRQRDRIEARRQAFVNIAGRHLAAPGPPLRRLSGRPPADDPFWQFRRSYGSE